MIIHQLNNSNNNLSLSLWWWWSTNYSWSLSPSLSPSRTPPPSWTKSKQFTVRRRVPLSFVRDVRSRRSRSAVAACACVAGAVLWSFKVGPPARCCCGHGMSWSSKVVSDGERTSLGGPTRWLITMAHNHESFLPIINYHQPALALITNSNLYISMTNLQLLAISCH